MRGITSAEIDLLPMEIGGARVEPRQLEEIDHHRVEAADLSDHDVECLLGPWSGRSARRPSRTSIAAESVVMGDRSSWLTSEAKRASRSMRALDGVGHLVERLASRSRSGSASSATRVSSPPDAMSPGRGRLTRPSGRSRRRLVHQPDAAASRTGRHGSDAQRSSDRAERPCRCG